MEKFVKLIAPAGRADFLLKLLFLMIISGSFNHIRDVLKHGIHGQSTFYENVIDAAFTAIPMCTFALILIGHLHTLQNRLYDQANRDVLTGLWNRRWFMDNTPRIFAARRALMIIDIDFFKSINDRFGHEVGDLCLQKFGEHFRQNLTGVSQYARVGGEEFAAYFFDIEVQDLLEIASRICSGILFDSGDGQMHRVTCSIGIAINSRRQSREQSFLQADKAAYEAKAKGRACFVIAILPQIASTKNLA